MIKLKTYMFADDNEIPILITTTADTGGIDEAIKKMEMLAQMVESTQKADKNEFGMTPRIDFSKLEPEVAQAKSLVAGMAAGVDTSKIQEMMSKINSHELVQNMFGSEDMSAFSNAWAEAIGNAAEEGKEIIQGMFNGVDLSVLQQQMSEIGAHDLVQNMFGTEDIEAFKDAWAKANGEIEDSNKSLFDKIKQGFATAKDAVDNFKTMAVNAFSKVKDKAKDMSTNLSKGFKDVIASLGITTSIAGITKALKKAVTSAADYQESLNLFHMALGEYYNDGLKWSKKIADALYLDDSEILQYTGSFFNLTKGLGASSDAAYLMSKNLTQLTYDMSSYLNIDVSQANTKLMSAMSGQTKAVTSVGIAVQSASLQELAYSMGIKKSIKDMTQAEKTYLRYIQIMRSTKQMQGDLGRTIITPTNAFRMLATQVTLLGRAIGQVLTPVIYKVMPILIALTHVLTDAAKRLAEFFGYQMADIDYSGVEGLTDDIKNLGKEVDKTSAKAHRMLAPFDELNVVESAGSGKGGGAGSILNQLEEYLTGYDMLADLNEKMADSIKEWEDKIKGLGPVILTVAGIVAGLKIIKFIGDIITKIGGIKTAITIIGEFVAPVFEKIVPVVKANIGKIGGIIGGVATMILSWQDAYKAVQDTAQDTFTNTARMAKDCFTSVVGGAIAGFAAFGPAGAVGGAILGLAGFAKTVETAYNDMIHNIAFDQLNQKLGEVNLSTEQWLTTLLGSDSTLMEVVTKIDEFNESISKNTENFNAAVTKTRGDILLYSAGVGEYAKISKDMLNTITTDMESMATNSSNGIKDYVDKNLLAMKDQWNNASEDERLALDLQMELLTQHGKDAEKEISDNKKAILEIYKKANKDKRQLTDKELKEVKEHLNKMNMAYGNFTGETKNVLATFFDETGKLRDGYSRESIENFVKVKGEYLQEIKDAADEEYNESQKYWKKLLDQGKIDNDKYNQMMKIAEEKRQSDVTKSQQLVAQYTQQMSDQLIEVYNSLDGKTDDVSKDMRKQLEGMFKDLDIKATDVSKPIENALDIAIGNMSKYDKGFKSAGEDGATVFANSMADKLEKTKFQVTVSTVIGSDGKSATLTPKVKAIKTKADGGYLDQGDLFIANEAGPEYITSIGNKSAVVNQGQMIAALSDALVKATDNLGANKPNNVTVYVGDKKLYQGQGEYQNRQNDRYGTTVVRI